MEDALGKRSVPWSSWRRINKKIGVLLSVIFAVDDLLRKTPGLIDYLLKALLVTEANIFSFAG